MNQKDLLFAEVTFTITIILVTLILIVGIILNIRENSGRNNVPVQESIAHEESALNDLVEPTITPTDTPTPTTTPTATHTEERPTTVSRSDYIGRPLYNQMSVLHVSGLTESDIESAVVNTPLAGLSTYYLQAERDTGISALFLLAMSIQESGWGKTPLARDRNNLFAFQAYDYDLNKAAYFESKGACILFVANYLKEFYLTEGAMYFNGYSAQDINLRYAGDKLWHSRIFSIMRSIQEKTINNREESK